MDEFKELVCEMHSGQELTWEYGSGRDKWARRSPRGGSPPPLHFDKPPASDAQDDDGQFSDCKTPVADESCPPEFAADDTALNLEEKEDPMPVSLRSENREPDALGGIPVADDIDEPCAVGTDDDNKSDDDGTRRASLIVEIELTEASPRGPVGGGDGDDAAPGGLLDKFVGGEATSRGNGARSSAQRV